MAKNYFWPAFFFGIGVGIHQINGRLSGQELETLWHWVPILVSWVMLQVIYTHGILDDNNSYGRIQGWKNRVTTNEAWPLLKVASAYIFILHIPLLFINYPVFEAILALAALGYFLHRYREV
jgi:hypothetical protein